MPPVIGQKPHEAAMAQLVLAPHSTGTTLFPVSAFPLPVYVYRILNETIVEGGVLTNSDVELVAWCEIYRTAEDACAATAPS
jgi:hypothetical protein